MTRLTLIVLILFVFTGSMRGQFTRQDTLRGSITPERAWWDLTAYDLTVNVDPESKTLTGSNIIYFTPVSEGSVMQIDLQEPMQIDEVLMYGRPVPYRRDGNAWFIAVDSLAPGLNQLEVRYSGKPRESVNPPWSGGITWKRDDDGNHFIASSCQGDGASLWWPCKDHMYDEPDSMHIRVRVPEELTDVSNGRLREVIPHGDGTRTFHWYVDNPINNYGVSINIGNYVHFGEIYQGVNGPLTCDYYVLPDNLSAAKEQFRQVKKMLLAFEHWFGPYPFYEDGFKLVEAPYLGMEHQSAVTYGNGYRNGYRGMDLSQTGWGDKFDFIIIHESGHEWFANNITYQDIADMWIHESFTAYSENLYLDYHFGTEAAREYVIGTRRNIRNDKPLIGPYGVNQAGSGDMYYKGANMLHMIRTMLANDSLWRATLQGLNKTFYHQTVTTREVEEYVISMTGLDLAPVFNQYLRDHRVPALEYYFQDDYIYARFTNSVPGFRLRLPVRIGTGTHVLEVTNEWSRHPEKVSPGNLSVQPDYYVSVLPLPGPENID